MLVASLILKKKTAYAHVSFLFVRLSTPVQYLDLKAETQMRLFSENCWECWVRIDKQVMCGSVYSYILGIRHYAPNRFSVLPHFWKRRILGRILANTVCESQFSRLLVNLCENTRECYEYLVFAYSRPFSENRHMCGTTLRLVSYKFIRAVFAVMERHDLVWVPLVHISVFAWTLDGTVQHGAQWYRIQS